MLQNVHFLLAILSRDKSFDMQQFWVVCDWHSISSHVLKMMFFLCFFSTIFAIRLKGTICDNNITPFSGILETLVHFRYI